MQHTHIHILSHTHITHGKNFAIDFPGGQARDLFLLAHVEFAVGPLLVALHVGQVLLRGLLAQRGGRWGA